MFRRENLNLVNRRRRPWLSILIKRNGKVTDALGQRKGVLSKGYTTRRRGGKKNTEVTCRFR